MTWSQLAWTGLYAIIIFFLGSMVGAWLTGLVRQSLERTSVDPALRRLLAKVVKPIVFIVFVVAGARVVGIDLSPVTAMLAACTLAIGLALQGSLSNVASGALLLTLRPYREGDFVSAGGRSGVVLEQGLFAVVLRGADGVMATIPNNNAFKGAILNYGRYGRRRVEINLTMAFEADLAETQTDLLAALSADARVLKDPLPEVIVVGTDAHGVKLSARAWVNAADYGATLSDLTIACVSLANAHGISQPKAMVASA